jgi:hypothetical protein
VSRRHPRQQPQDLRHGPRPTLPSGRAYAPTHGSAPALNLRGRNGQFRSVLVPSLKAPHLVVKQPRRDVREFALKDSGSIL